MAIPTIEQVEESGKNMDTITEFVKSGDPTLVDQYGDTRNTMKGNQDRIDEAIRSAGYEIVGDFSDSVKVELTESNQVYTSYAISNHEDALWRPVSLPYTPTGSDPTIAPELGKWVAVAQGELKSLARSLNVLDGQVIYASDTSLVLDNVLYIYDKAYQVTYEKFKGIPDGLFIVSISGNVLTTTGGNYTLIKRGVKKSYLDASFTTPAVQYIAHRGLSKVAPENTLPAYSKAGDAGFWGGECDLQLTQDGEWILMHDDTVDRTTNGTGVVSDLTLNYIKTLDAGTWFNSYYEGVRVPTLTEYLKVCRQSFLIPVIEVKSATYTTENYQDLIDQCKAVFPDYQFVIISSSFSRLGVIRSLDEGVNLQVVIFDPYSEAIIDECAAINCWLDISFAQLPADTSYAESRNVYINVFTVNSQTDANSAVSQGVRQITTDFINLTKRL